jgi:D-3-phosphoglycerate dehydrogenase / 2-oxoglutarate reductase
MKVVIPDDYQDAVRSLACFSNVAAHEVTIYRDTVTGIDELARRFAHAECLVLIRERTRITAELLERLPHLKLIAQTGRAGGHIDLEACTRRGVVVTAGKGSPNPPAELTWALILAALRHVPLEDRRMREGRWQTTLGTGLKGRALGIYGYGSIGALVAKAGVAFGMRVLALGREGSAQRARADGLEVASSKAQLFSESDVLSLHLKLTPETRGIVSGADLAAMKPTALFVNTSRDGLVQKGALAAALTGGRPGHAAVDVYDLEPVPRDHPLLAMDNVVCTPHLGYVVRDSYELYFGQAFDQINAYVAGKPVNAVNPEALGKR